MASAAAPQPRKSGNQRSAKMARVKTSKGASSTRKTADCRRWSQYLAERLALGSPEQVGQAREHDDRNDEQDDLPRPGVGRFRHELAGERRRHADELHHRQRQEDSDVGPQPEVE